MNTPVSFTTESSKLERLEAIARMARCERDVIINDALDSYLEFYALQSERVRKVRPAADEGRTYSTEEARMMIEEYHERRKAGR